MEKWAYFKTIYTIGEISSGPNLQEKHIYTITCLQFSDSIGISLSPLVCLGIPLIWHQLLSPVCFFFHLQNATVTSTDLINRKIKEYNTLMRWAGNSRLPINVSSLVFCLQCKDLKALFVAVQPAVRQKRLRRPPGSLWASDRRCWAVRERVKPRALTHQTRTMTEKQCLKVTPCKMC